MHISIEVISQKMARVKFPCVESQPLKTSGKLPLLLLLVLNLSDIVLQFLLLIHCLNKM